MGQRQPPVLAGPSPRGCQVISNARGRRGEIRLLPNGIPPAPLRAGRAGRRRTTRPLERGGESFSLHQAGTERPRETPSSGNLKSFGTFLRSLEPAPSPTRVPPFWAGAAGFSRASRGARQRAARKKQPLVRDKVPQRLGKVKPARTQRGARQLAACFKAGARSAGPSK